MIAAWAESFIDRSRDTRQVPALMMGAIRHGFANQMLDAGVQSGINGAGATHAWLHGYLPGAGWVPCDPTNLVAGGHSLIRVAHARHPAQAVPLAGNWLGAGDDDLGMAVHVSIRRLPD